MNEHKRTLRHITWYINDTLVGEEQARVSKHLEKCLVCREEYADQLKVAEAVRNGETTVYHSAQALSLLQTRLSHDSGFIARSVRILHRLTIQTPRPVKFALAVQAALLAIVGSFMWSPLSVDENAGEYRTLSQTQPPPGDIRILFTPTSTQIERSRLLNELKLDMSGEVSERGVYTVNYQGNPDGVVNQLRASDIVMLAEPASTANGPTR